MIIIKLLKLTEVANKLGISKRTLYNWKYSGKIKFEKYGYLNYLTYDEYLKLLGEKTEKEDKIVIYARTSSAQNKKMLDAQADRLISYCYAKGYKIHKIVKEYGSGMNDNRKLLTKLLESGDFTKIIVEHKDRLTRTGFNYLKILLEKENKTIEIVNNAEDNTEEIIQDFVSIITSYCAKIYGKRRAKRKTEIIVENLKMD